MIYVYAYLAIGATACVCVFAANWRTHEKDLKIGIESIDSETAGRRSMPARVLIAVVRYGLALVAWLLLWPLIAMVLLVDYLIRRFGRASPGPREFQVQRGDLNERLTVQEIEIREMVHDHLGGVPSLPFAHLNPAWRQFLSTIKDGDEIWSFTARPGPNAYDNVLRQGYVRVHGDKPGHYVLTVCKHVSIAKDDAVQPAGLV